MKLQAFSKLETIKVDVLYIFILKYLASFMCYFVSKISFITPFIVQMFILVLPIWDHFTEVKCKCSQYVLEELNVKLVVPCNDPLKYASLRVEPNFRYVVAFNKSFRIFQIVVANFYFVFCFSVLGKKFGEVNGCCG